MRAAIRAIASALPERELTNAGLALEYPGWSVEKIEQKTGIATRHIAAADECSSDLGVRAAEALFATGACSPAQVDYLLFCTQSPDYFLPPTACLVQARLGIPTSAGALEINQGCSGYVYGLGLAQGLIETGQARRVLLITSETYSKFIHPGDRSVRTIFGDGAAATLVEGVPEAPEPWLGPFVYGTDGRGGPNLIVPTGGMRSRRTGVGPEIVDAQGNSRTEDNLYMNGPEIFTFTLDVVPGCVAELLTRAGKSLDDIDLFVFHQANLYMLEYLRKKLKIPAEKFVIALRGSGNTVSSTIPIALGQAVETGALRPGQTAMLLGFGVGYSWAGTIIRWGA